MKDGSVFGWNVMSQSVRSMYYNLKQDVLADYYPKHCLVKTCIYILFQINVQSNQWILIWILNPSGFLFVFGTEAIHCFKLQKINLNQQCRKYQTYHVTWNTWHKLAPPEASAAIGSGRPHGLCLLLKPATVWRIIIMRSLKIHQS